MTTVRVSRKGWIVVPAPYRKKMGLKPGDLLEVVETDGILSLTPLMKDPVEEACGILAGGPSLTQALVKEHARERAREELS